MTLLGRVIRSLFLIGFLASWSAETLAQTSASARLPGEVPLAEIEMGLELLPGGGGCLGRCAAYRIVILGTGRVDFDDLSGAPRVPHQQRMIAADEAVSLLNDFLAARFFERPASYDGLQAARRTGDSVQILQHGAADNRIWILSLRVGARRKNVRLALDEPEELTRLRERMSALGGVKP